MSKFKEFLKSKSISEEAYKALDAEEMAALYVEYNDAQRANIEKAVEAKASKEDILSMKQELLDGITEQHKALNEVLKAQGMEIKRISEMSHKPGAVPISELKAALLANKDKLAEFRAKGPGNFLELDVKVVGTMTIAGSTTGEIPQSDREPGMNRIQDRRPFVSQYISSGSTMKDTISWVEQANREGVAGGTAEGAAKNQIDFALVVASESIKKRTAFIKVSEEMLADIDFMDSEIRSELIILLDLDVDNQLLQGDNIGTNLNGLITQATTFAAGTFAASIENANNYDALRVAINQIMLENFMPNVIFMNPSDVTGMQLTKGTDGHYISFPFVSQDGTRILDIPIVQNNGVPADTFLVMDGSRAKRVNRQGLTIRVGYEMDDFTKNLVTILAETRLALRIKGNDIPAFVTGEFSVAKAALEMP